MVCARKSQIVLGRNKNEIYIYIYIYISNIWNCYIPPALNFCYRILIKEQKSLLLALRRSTIPPITPSQVLISTSFWNNWFEIIELVVKTELFPVEWIKDITCRRTKGVSSVRSRGFSAWAMCFFIFDISVFMVK